MRPSTASVDARQTNLYLTEAKKVLFSHIRSSIVFEWKYTSFAVETLSG